MADHLDAPGLTSPAMDARVDITDHYAFQKPDHPDRTILILNVNPLAPAHAAEFRSDAIFRSDPFFFDLVGFLNGLKFTGADFFADKNVFGIALDIPSSLLGSNPKVGIWTRTRVPMTLQPDRLMQADQMGRPAINTVFNHGSDKNTFNVTQPATMRTTLSTVAP